MAAHSTEGIEEVSQLEINQEPDQQETKRTEENAISNTESIISLFDCFEDGGSEDGTNPSASQSEETQARTENYKKILQGPLQGPEVAKLEESSRDLRHNIKVHTLKTIESCTHEVACPPNEEYFALQPRHGPPLKEYPFTLDPFQNESIACVDNNQSVLVSAHTSAGKTVIAEYAIAKAFKNQQRIIYTTPIKALSNQKYREFLEQFEDVGLVTGDVTINPGASCLIMTTEILRCMLYRGSEIMREVGWVIFDEIHYMRDSERGVVWEESIILLPHRVRFVFLSATIPNARQFAEWIAYLYKQPCHVVYTDYRPTPLQYYLFAAGANGIHMVVDDKGAFHEDNFSAAMATLQNAPGVKDNKRGRQGGAVKDPSQSNIFKVVKMIMERGFAPVIVFSFSKKDCELYAMQLTKMNFNTVAEQKAVRLVFDNAMDVLSEEDKRLPQVQNMLPLLLRGIGIHHGGLLPILKETIEILFGEGLIKALFATETFAMGLNMPARTVLFTGINKFDGNQRRLISSAEYIQMSGRAGRRGLDDQGIVILMVDEAVPPASIKDLMKGSADPINSAFHLTYNMILNLTRIEEMNPEFMLERSFYQFQFQSNFPSLQEDYQKKKDEFDAIKINNLDQIATYCNIRKELDLLSRDYRDFIIKPEYFIPFMQPGRLVKIVHENVHYNWGLVVNFKKQTSTKTTTIDGKRVSKPCTTIQLHVLLNIPEDKSSTKPCGNDEKSTPEVISVDSKDVTHISEARLHCPDDVRPLPVRKALMRSIKEIERRFPEGPPILDPVESMGIKEPEFLLIIQKIKLLESKLFAHPLHKTNVMDAEYHQYKKKMSLEAAVNEAAEKLSAGNLIQKLDELKARKQVLVRLGYCTAEDVIKMKGRVACELNCGDELVITEVLFNGVFNKLTPEQATAFLSCLVCDERAKENPKINEELCGPLRDLQEAARLIAKISLESGLPIDEDEYVNQFRPHLMDVVLAWCNGASFAEICKTTEIFEGSIVRCMRRLEELLRQMMQASKTIGNDELETKFTQAIKILKRDIVFSSSLYL
ncbi:unnamed protein product [Ceutorhynchus assimilis]|uniref:Superkiller viralicidic activity 2-like 2 n=1 Tax=Ceutorhynchus assimilis TaxID=467358 RepID=A0A9N9MER5_9CUCU|nr:unnamed protein product [Ceutorhynchus assimilis]